jgi:hypothetical protein
VKKVSQVYPISKNFGNYARSTDHPSICWLPPLELWINLKCDGSFLSNNRVAACGGVLCNHYGNFVVGYVCNLGSFSITHAYLC